MINVKETFLKLTSRRYPNGTEDLAMGIVKELLPSIEFNKDEFGNYFLNILKSNGEPSDTMFTSHLDTIDSGPWKSDKIWDQVSRTMIPNPAYEAEKIGDKSIVHVMEGDFVKTDGNTNLGADDKAGTTIMMNLISENVPGLYYFFVGEESGCIGSSALSRVFMKKDFQEISRCIAFDRRGYDSVITSQGGVCASNAFATELASRLNEYGFWYKPDPTGVYTDSAEFVDIISECSNLSVGYFSEHTKTEKQDLDFLELLAIVATKIEWDTLPTVREKTKVYTGKKSTYKKYTGTTYGGYSDYGYGYGDGGYWSRPTTIPKKSEVVTVPKSNDTQLNFEFDAWYDQTKAGVWK